MNRVVAIVIENNDNVATLCEDCEPYDYFIYNNRNIRIKTAQKIGSKIALENISKGTKIKKYGSVIGTCFQNIKEGEWVHSHNLRSDYQVNS